jgi:hypothetical protein
MPVCREAAENPFARTKLVRGNVIPPGVVDRDSSGEYHFRVMEWMAYMFVRENWQSLGAAQMWSMLNRDRNGKLCLRQMAEFLPIEAFRELSQFGS